MRSLTPNLGVLAALLAFSNPSFGISSRDVQIQAIAAQWQQCWNAHDMHALFSLFTVDADFVNVGAKHWRGREEIEAEHVKRLPQFKDSTWSNRDMTVQYLRADVALVHLGWSIVGDRDPDGTQRKPREGLFTWVVVKKGREWHVRAAQNTNVSNARPAASEQVPALPGRE